MSANKRYLGLQSERGEGGGLRVSCTIIALNEADRIGLTIESVRGLVDEVLVIDSGSTDGTQALCEKLGARVIFNPWPGYGPQKRFAEDEARNDIILNLDADEWLSDALREEFKALFKGPDLPRKSYRVKVTIIYPHRPRPALFADSNNCLRLYDRRVTRFANSMVHDEVVPTPDVGQIKAQVFHRSFRSLGHLVRKDIVYFELQAKELKKTKWKLLARAPFEFFLQFFKFYILRRHIFGGLYGLVFSLSLGFVRWLRLFILMGW